MKTRLLFLMLAMASLTPSFAEVVRLAPDFSWQGAAGSKRTSLKGLRGQPVVLVIAKSAREGSFRKQAKRLKEIYHEFASRNVVFVAAFAEEGGVVPSDVPFVIANNGAAVAASYQVDRAFGLVVIGKDGNVDMQTSRVVPATRIRDVIINSYPVQAQERNTKKQ